MQLRLFPSYRIIKYILKIVYVLTNKNKKQMIKFIQPDAK